LRCFNKFVDNGGCRGNTTQALTRWWYPVASSEARDVLYWVMHPASYRCIAMAAHMSDWGDSLNQCRREGQQNTMVMMFVGGVVLTLDGILILLFL
jgi:hypothetical protein